MSQHPSRSGLVMRRPLSRSAFRIAMTLVVIFCTQAQPAWAWNGRGHRLIAWMAFEQLDEKTKNELARILEKHPAEGPWWREARFNPRDERLALMVNASVFPDQARPDTKFSRYFRPRAHYVNHKLIVERNRPVRLEEPQTRPSDENVINTYLAHVKTFKDRKNTPEERAVALSWIIHQVGDVHQPLHAAARFCPATPNGDQGGNLIEVPNDNGPDNLHAYWDGVLGREENPPSLDRETRRLLRDFPRDRFRDELQRGKIQDWVRESAEACRDVVYANLPADETRLRDLPVGYAADARKLAERRVALASYRLADVLRDLVQDQGQNPPAPRPEPRQTPDSAGR